MDPGMVMNRRQILIFGLLIGASGLAWASLGSFSQERNVSGKIVEIDKHRGIAVLSDFTGWDREQMKRAHMSEKAATKRWLDGIDPKHAAIYLKVEDASKLRKGDRVRIPAYKYAFESLGNGAKVEVVPSYEKLEISPKS